MKSDYTSLKKSFYFFSIARGLIFWYAIEKLFEIHIGITLPQIVLIGVVAQGSKVIFELPTSIVADRWSRRNILIIADLSFIVSAIILGLSSSVFIYIIGILFWSLNDALSSGVYEAFTYDSLATNGFTDRFKKLYTRMNSIELIILAFTGLLAGVLSNFVSLRFSFFISVVPILGSIYVLLKMSEPKIVRTSDQGIGWLRHLSGSFKLMNARLLRWVVIMYIALIGLQSIWFEYYQLIGIQIKVPTIWFGSLIGILTLGMALGAELAHKLRADRWTLLGVWVALIVTHVIGLHFRNTWVIILDIFVAFVALKMMQLYMELFVQGNVDSNRRATILSLATTLSYAWFFVLAAVFALTLKSMGARQALVLTSLPLVVVGVIDIVRRIPWSIKKTAADVEVI